MSNEPRGGPLQRRLSALTGLAVATSMLVTGVAAYVATNLTLFAQLDAELIEVAQIQSPRIAADLDNMGGLNADALKAANVTLMLLGSDGSVDTLPGEDITLNLRPREMAVARTQEGSSSRSGEDAAGVPYRIVSVPLETSADSGYYALVIARPLQPTLNVLHQLAIVLTTFGVIMAGVSALVGAWLARQALDPVQRLRRAVARVTETDKLTPIEAHGDDEISDLARSFNTMLNSLGSSRERQRRLIADAGHELRTPLTSMRTNIELLVADGRSGMLPEGARGEILRDVAAQVTELTSLVGDLAQLSREDQVSPDPESVDLSEVVRTAVARAQRRGPGLAFDVTLEEHTLMGEADQLERALTNLLDNAVKFSPPGGRIEVTMADQKITISDDGPGIAAEDLPHVFDRFYRSEKARNTPGTGLGLSIVHHVATSHGGWVTAGRSASGGAQFTMWLPSDSLLSDEDTIALRARPEPD